MKKKYFIISISIVVLLIFCFGFSYYKYSNNLKLQANKEIVYSIKLKQTMSNILSESALIDKVVNGYATEWKFIVNGGVFVATDGHQMNFSEAVDFKKKEFANQGVLKDFENQKNNIEKNMSDLNQPSQKYKDSYNVLFKAYQSYVEFEGIAQNPTGSLNSFAQKIQDLPDQIVKKSDEFNVKFPK